MHRHFRTLGYFLIKGASYGTIFGMVAGSLIVPIIGSIFAMFFGLGIGIIMGLSVGVITVIYNAVVVNFDTDLVHYRRRLTLGIGIFTAMSSAALILIINPFTMGIDFAMLIIPPLSAFFWGGLASAYAASRYADWYMTLIVKQKNDAPLPTIRKDALELSGWYWVIFFPFGLFLLVVGTIAGVVWNSLLHSPIDSIGMDLVGGLFGGVFLSALIVMINMTANSFAFGLIFRIVFQEYRFNRDQYRFGMTTMAFMLTTCVGFMWYFFVNIIPGTEPADFLILIMGVLFAMCAACAAYLTALKQEHIIYGIAKHSVVFEHPNKG